MSCGNCGFSVRDTKYLKLHISFITLNIKGLKGRHLDLYRFAVLFWFLVIKDLWHE